MKKFKFPFIIAALGIAVATSCSDDNAENSIPSTIDTKAWNLDADMDTTISPGDNFFMYCNGKFWNETEAPVGVNCICPLMDGAEKHVSEILASISDPNYTKYVQDTLDIDKTTESALATIRQKIEALDAITTKEEAWKVYARLIAQGYPAYYMLNPISNHGKIVLTLSLVSTETEQVDWMEYAQWRLGLDEDTTSVIEMVKANRQMAMMVRTTPTLKDLKESPKCRENFKPYSEIASQTRSGGFDAARSFLDILGINEDYFYVTGDALQNLYDNSTKDLLISVVKQAYLTDVANASREDANAYRQYNGESLNNTRQLMNTICSSYMVSYAYASACMTEALKNEFIGYCKQMQASLRKRIEQVEWMSSTTKQNALDKLDAMNINVAYPDKWIEVGLPTLSGASYVEDLITLRQAYANTCKAIAGKSIQEESFTAMIITGTPLTTVNAFYYPSFNSINILPAWLMKPIYDTDKSDACTYGIFYVIGHELTHGFDKNGSQYDKNGDSKNWWTVADKMEFEERQQLLIDCYNNIEVLPDEMPNVYGNGTQTLAENTADLGGLLVVYDVYKEKLTNEGYTGDEFVKQEKKFFQAFASVWKSKYGAEFAKNRIASDVHSLFKDRINGTVMNIDRWYELYDVQWGDQLYLKPEKRAKIW